MSISQSRKRKNRRKKLEYHNKQRQLQQAKEENTLRTFKNATNQTDVISEHESRLRGEWAQTLSDILPTGLQIDIIIKDIAEYSYPIYYGIYAGYWCKLIYLNRNGQCKYEWKDDYWHSPLNQHPATVKCCNDLRRRIIENKLKYQQFDKWDYDFNTNTLSIRAYGDYLDSLQIITCKLEYGNKAEGFQKDFKSWNDMEQSEYEWTWKGQFQTQFGLGDLGKTDIDSVFDKLSTQKEVEIRRLYFMQEI